ncbi:hypothetical protein AC15_0833 [Escherichia coli 2-156-04_S3_C2]|nr:hypothetical protein AC15_0833 [Escherichia coli 2-156-04_S3_C2]
MIISSGYILRFIFTPIFTSGNYPLLPFFNYQKWDENKWIINDNKTCLYDE